jgi:uncharacterized small protein (DUF1192 family)
MMGAMMFFMHRSGGHGAHGDNDAHAHDTGREASSEPLSLEGLQGLRDELDSRLGELDARIDELEQEEDGGRRKTLARV